MQDLLKLFQTGRSHSEPRHTCLHGRFNAAKLMTLSFAGVFESSGGVQCVC